MELQLYHAQYVDRQNAPLFTKPLYAEGYWEACCIALDTCPQGAEFHIVESEDPLKGAHEAMIATEDRFLYLLGRKANVANKPPVWVTRFRKRQRPSRHYAEQARECLPATLIYGCFSNDDLAYELYRIMDRPSFVAKANLTLEEVMVLALENLGEMAGDYLAGLDPRTGRVAVKLALAA